MPTWPTSRCPPATPAEELVEVPANRHAVIGTAGHVDHGKTALIRALTGHDTDRLPEEQARGISIDLGFAHLTLPSGRRAGIVDVPGHERFVHNMLAGAAGIDLALLVIAADEGVMPQTREHIHILDLLGIRQGAVALTKADLVDDEWLNLVAADVRDALAGTFLAQAPLLPVSSVTGAGMPTLVALLDDMLRAAPGRTGSGLARLPIDRVFTRPGFGTIVTGTLAAGRIRVDDRLSLLPAGVTVRVRGVHVHGETVPAAAAGQRVAVNLHGVDHADVHRGDVLAMPGACTPTQALAGTLRLLPGAPPLRHGRPVHVHLGTAEAVARIILLGQDELAPGSECFAVLRCDRSLVAARGDRFIIRSYSPVTTIGGGTVLQTNATFRRSSREALKTLQRLAAGGADSAVAEALRQAGTRLFTRRALAQAAGLDEETASAELAPLLASGDAVALGDDAIIGGAALAALQDAVVRYIDSEVKRQPLQAGVLREQLRQRVVPSFDGRQFALVLRHLEQCGVVTPLRDRVVPAGGLPPLPPDLAQAVAAVANSLRAGGLTPPGPEALAKLVPARIAVADVLHYLSATGAAVPLAAGIWMHEEAVDQAAKTVTAVLRADGEATMSVLRERLGTSRKFAVPLLEHFDRLGITRRHGDVRTLGPAAQRLEAGDEAARAGGVAPHGRSAGTSTTR